MKHPTIVLFLAACLLASPTAARKRTVRITQSPVLRPQQPDSTAVTGDYDNGILTFHVSGYVGEATLRIHDTAAHISQTVHCNITPSAPDIIIDFAHIPRSRYSLVLTLLNSQQFTATLMAGLRRPHPHRPTHTLPPRSH